MYLLSYIAGMKNLDKPLEQFCADNNLHLLACYTAPGRPPGEAATLLLFSDEAGAERFFLWGYYEEVKGGWDWSEHSDDEDIARAAFLACLPIERSDS